MAYLAEIRSRPCARCRRRPATHQLHTDRSNAIAFYCAECGRNALHTLTAIENRERPLAYTIGD